MPIANNTPSRDETSPKTRSSPDEKKLALGSSPLSSKNNSDIHIKLESNELHQTITHKMAWGIMASLGSIIAWPFRLCNIFSENIARSLGESFGFIFKWAVLLILFPGLLVIGVQILSESDAINFFQQIVAQIIDYATNLINR